MKRISIVLKMGILFACLIFCTCAAIGIGIYGRVSAIVDEEAHKSIEHMYNLMDNTLSDRVRNIDSMMKDFSLNQPVRDHLRQPGDVDSVQAAKDFSSYVDNMKATRPEIYCIKVFDVQGCKVIHSGGRRTRYYVDDLPDGMLEAISHIGDQQYWVRGEAEFGSQRLDTIRIFTSIFDLDRLEPLGILEVELLSSSLFHMDPSEVGADLKVFMVGRDGILWGPESPDDDFVAKMLAMDGETQTLYSTLGAHYVFRGESASGTGTFYLAKLTDDMKRANRELVLYMLLVMAVIVVVILAAAFWISQKMLQPLVRLKKLVNRADPESGLAGGAAMEMAHIAKLGNEVGGLARSFEGLIGKIQASMANIEQVNAARRKLELELLTSQIKPHFLYNTIEVICSLSRLGKMEELYNLAKSLGVFYRLSLSKGNVIVSVENELSHVESYINIERIRRGYAFEFAMDIEPGVRRLRVLKMLLQPVVENALQHGIRGMEEGGVLSVSAALSQEDILVFEVLDNGRGISADVLRQLNEGSYVSSQFDGFGMQNVQARIKLYYGEAYGMRFFSEPGLGTRVRITVPAGPVGFHAQNFGR